jgi:hypothetical protein
LVGAAPPVGGAQFTVTDVAVVDTEADAGALGALGDTPPAVTYVTALSTAGVDWTSFAPCTTTLVM